MPRPPAAPISALGQAVQARRGQRTGRELSEEIGIPYSTLYRLEAGRSAPSLKVARVLAGWLGWTVEQVATRAEQPPGAVVAQAAPAPEPEPPKPPADLTTRALRLPDGRVLDPWSELGPGSWQRKGGAPYSVLADARGAKLKLKGLDYTDDVPGRDVAERRALLDAWLITRGAQDAELSAPLDGAPPK